ncbi:MAG: hypothetical protein H7641_08875 [Candidatus Heimdallarchaeota archaeon]|nr:hypothetical protein [Candidatus Heimdallarchaeota archaeon]MCK4877679.1 hypothetical protein [Candidatus Heimdallarchaeota archaeon]
MEETKKYSLLKQGAGTKFLITFGITIVLSKGLSIAFTKIFTNILPQEEMGQYAIFVTASMTILAYASIGFQSALNLYTVKYKVKGQKKNLQDLVFSGFISFVVIEAIIIGVFLILYFASGFYPSFLDIEPYVITLLAVGVIALAQFFSTLCYNIAGSLQNSRYYAIPVIMRILLQIPLGIIFVVVLDQGLLGLILGVSAAELIVAIYSGFVLIKDLGIGKFSFKELKSVFAFSTPVYGMTILLRTFNLYLLVYIDQVYSQEGEALIALYIFGAVPIANILLMVGQMFRTVYRPIIFKYYESKKLESMENLTIMISKLYGIIIIALCILLFAFSPLLITYIFTNSTYLAGIYLIPLLFISKGCEQLTNIIAYGHTIKLKNYWVLVAGIISVGSGALTAYFLIPTMGLLGIGVVYVVIKGSNLIVLTIVSQRYFKIHYDYKVVLKILVSAIVSIGIGIIFNLYVIEGGINITLIVPFLISAILYVGLIFLFRLIKKEDYNFVKTLVKSYISTRTTSV